MHPLHPSYGHSYPTASEPSFGGSEHAGDAHMELEVNMRREVTRLRQEEQQQQQQHMYALQAMHSAHSTTQTTAQPRSAGKRPVHDATNHPLVAQQQQHPRGSPHHMLPPQPARVQQSQPRHDSPFSDASALSANPFASPLHFSHSGPHSPPHHNGAIAYGSAEHHMDFSSVADAVKQEAMSPVRDDSSIASSPTQASAASSTTTSDSSSSSSSSSASSSSSSSASSSSSSDSSSSSVESAFPLPRNLPVSREVLSRLPFSFVVHLRVDDRVYLPRLIVTPLTVSISQVLHMATNISTFVAVHSNSSSPISDDASILDIPAVLERLRERATRLHNRSDADQLPLYKSSHPILLPRTTPMALTLPPAPRGGKRSRAAGDECEEDDDEAEMADGGGRDRLGAGEDADPHSIHLLFDLAQDVKACTRLGCVNMLVKKSSRRSCDDCQDNGYQLPADTILRFCSPTDKQQPFSHLSPAEKASVRGHLNAAISAAVDVLEYWKFEVPDEEAYFYTFVSATAARQALEHFHYLLAVDKSQPALALVSPHRSLAIGRMRDVVGDSSTDSEPSANSQSRSGNSGSSDDPTLSDSESDPTVPRRRRKNSTSRSTNSNSSNDMLGRSTASTSSNSSSSINSPHHDADPSSPRIAAPVMTALTGLLAHYPYSSHLQCVDAESGVYSLKMKSHFWKLEVKPYDNAAAAKGKAQKVRIYKKVGAKRPAEKPSNGKRPPASVAARASLSKNGTQSVTALLAKARTSAHTPTPTLVEASPDLLPVSFTSSPAPVDHAQQQKQLQQQLDWAMAAVAPAAHPLAEHTSARRRGASDAEFKSNGVSHIPHRSPVSSSSQLPPLFTSAPTSHHLLGLDHVDAAAAPYDHDQYDIVLPSTFNVDDPLQVDASIDSFLSTGYHSDIRTSVTHNSVLVSRHDHEHLMKQKPVGATLSVHSVGQNGDAGHDGHEARVGVGAPTPVLLVYRDHQQYARDVSHGFLVDKDGSGGAGRDGWGGGGGGGYDDRKDGGGDHRRGGGGGGGGGADDFDGHNGKRRRIDHHHLSRDAVAPSSASAPSASGDGGGDDKRKALLQEDWLEPWKHAGAMAPAEPPSRLAALLNAQQAPSIWLCLLVLLSVVGVVLFTYNLGATGDTLRLVSMQPDNALIDFQSRSTMSSAANMFSQMRVASPVFNSWVQEKVGGISGNLFLADNDATTDILYPLSSKQLDIVPGSVVSSYGVNSVRSLSAMTEQQRTQVTQLNYTEVVQRCQESTNTAKAVGDFLVSANALGQSFAYHFLGTPLSVINTTLNFTAIYNDSLADTTGSGGSSSTGSVASGSSTGQAGYNNLGSSSSSAPATMESSSTGVSFGSYGQSGDEDEWILDYAASTLASPPKPEATCALIYHEVGMAFIRQFLCKAISNIDSPYTPLLLHQCRQPHFNCTEFVWTIFSSNLTNDVFAIQTLTYSTDALLIALHYHQQAAVLAPTCAGFEIMTHDQLNNFQATATLAHIDVGVLVGLVMGAAALMAVGVLLVVMLVNAAIKWRADKRQAEAAQERRRVTEERRKEREQALAVEEADGGDVRLASRVSGGLRRRQSLDGQSIDIEMQ